MVQISRIFDKRGWTQKQAAEFLGVTQPRISDLARARAENFTIDLLVDWLGELGQSVSIEAKQSSTSPHSLLHRFNTTEDSIPYYTKAITIDPLCATNYLKRGDAYFAQNKYDLAVGDYTRALELNTARSDWRLRRADAFIKLEQYKAAIYDCQLVLEQVKNKRVSAFDEFDSGENAKQVIQEIAWWTYLCLGRALLGAEHEDEAIEAFENAIHTAPHFGRAYFERARLQEKKKNYREALEDYSRACQCDPSDVPSSDHLAALRRKLLQEQGQGDSQGIVLKQAPLKQDEPKSTADAEIDGFTSALEAAATPSVKAHFFRKRAEAFHNRRQYTLAIADFTRAVELDPQQNWVWSYVTYGRFMTGDYNGVIRDCDNIIDSDWAPTQKSGAYMYKGWALEKFNLQQQALECYRQGLALNPQDTSLTLARGVLLEKMGKAEEALADYRQTIYLSATTPGVAREFIEQAKEYVDHLEGKMSGHMLPPSIVDRRDVELIVYDRLSLEAEQVFQLGTETALAMGHDCFCTEFLLIGLLRERNSSAAKQLEEVGVRLADVEAAVEIILGRYKPIKRSGRFCMSVTGRMRHVLQLTLDYSLHSGYNVITPEHLLLGMILEILACQKLQSLGIASDKDELFGVAARIILELNIDVEKFRWSIVKESWG
jgi:tetratricopeptide (TPR) repeat protein